MAKRFCKMNRKQIAENLGDIHRLVVEPKYLCRSCARSSADKESLCKPAAIPPQACQNQPLQQQKSCALLAEALPQPAPLSEQKAQAVQRVVERAKQKASQRQTPQPTNPQQTTSNQPFDLSDQKAIKKAKKALKKHYKQQKKLLKLAKKQYKLQTKQNKLEAQLNLSSLVVELGETQTSSSLH